MRRNLLVIAERYSRGYSKCLGWCRSAMARLNYLFQIFMTSKESKQ